LGLTKSVAPIAFAIVHLSGLTSIPMMRFAFAITAPCTTAKPIAPSPNTATVEPGRTLATLSTAPTPVVMPQPSRHTLSSGAFGSIFATDISGSTVYSENVLVPM